MTLLQNGIWMIIEAFFPIALGTVVTGLLVTLAQSWLHLNDVSLSFVPKLVVVAVILIFGWWVFVLHFVHWFHALAMGMPTWLQD